MPTVLTEIDVKNLALDLISEVPLQAGETNPYSRWMDRNFANVRDGELRRNPWNFSIAYHELTQDATDPAFRWDYSYDLPPLWLRLLPPTKNGVRGAAPVPHEVVKQQVYTNDAGPTLPVRVIERVENPGAWDSLFVDVVAAKLAMRMSIRFTAKRGYLDDARNAYLDAFSVARDIDALEGTPEPSEQSDIITVRGI